MDRFLNGLLVAICIVQEISSFDEHIYEPLSCLVTGIDLYVDEKKLSPLTSAQQIEFAEYQKQMADYERDVQKYEELMSQGDAGLPPPQPPPRPSFCNVPMVYLDGCVALADKLFVGNSFVRNLSADEQKKIGNFIEHSKKYVEDQMRTLNGHDGSNGDINDMMNISNAELMDLFSVQMPENLNICTSL